MNKYIFFAICCTLLLSIGATHQTFGQDCANATPITLEPCSPIQTYTVPDSGPTDAANNSGSCGLDGDYATWLVFTLAAPYTGFDISFTSNYGGCSNPNFPFTCFTDMTGALYSSADGTCGTLTAIDDCIDFTNPLGTLYQSSFTPLAPGTYYIRISEEDGQGGFAEVLVNATPLDGDATAGAIPLSTANGTYCNFNGSGNDCSGANDGNSCIGTVDNTIFYSFTVDANTTQPVTFGLENIICDGSMQMVVVSDDCSASQGTGGNCSVSTGSAAPQLMETLPLGDYLLVIDGTAGDNCSWELSSSIIDDGAACDEFTGISTFWGCSGITICVGYDPTSASDPTGMMMTVDVGGAAAFTTLADDGVANWDLDGDNVADINGYCLSYDMDPALMGCDPVPFTPTVTVTCADGTPALLGQDIDGDGFIDPGNGITLTAYDYLNGEFGIPGGTALYPSTFTAVETPGGCGAAPSVVINAGDGTQCDTDTGTAPTTPACDSGLTESSPLSYSFDYSDSSADPVLSVLAIDCSVNVAATVAADCAAAPCAAVCDITGITAAGPVCSADGTSYSVTVTVVGGPDTSVTLGDAASNEGTGVAATSTVTFTYPIATTPYNIVVTDTEGLCQFGPFTGAAPNCSTPCPADNGTLSIGN